MGGTLTEDRIQDLLDQGVRPQHLTSFFESFVTSHKMQPDGDVVQPEHETGEVIALILRGQRSAPSTDIREMNVNSRRRYLQSRQWRRL